MAPTLARPTAMQALLALVLPAALAVGWAAWALQADPPEASAKVREMDAAVDAAAPEVVVVGNSIARVSLDEPRVAEAIGAGGHHVRLSVDGFTSAGWYTLLKNRVYARGHRPKLVIVPNTPWFALLSEPPSPLARARLAEQVGTDDVEVLAKLSGGSSAWWMERVRKQRMDAREGVLGAVKRLALAPFAADEDDGEALLAEVFEAEGAVDVELHRAAMPIVEIDRDARGEVRPSLDGSMMRELVELVESHGGRVLFVNVPLAPHAGMSLGDLGAERDLIALFNGSARSGYVDLSGLAVPASGFADPLHLNSLGRRLLTDALVEWLVAVGAAAGGELPDALPPIAPTAVRRTGTADPLPAAELLAKGEDEPACCRRLRVPGLAALADDALERRALHATSPVEVRVGGGALVPGATVADREAGCGGVSSHRGALVFACPTEEPEDGDLVVGLSPAVPLTTPRHPRSVWWVYPGTALEVELPPAERAGELRAVWVEVDGAGEVGLAVDGAPVTAERRGRRATVTLPLAQGAAPVLRWSSTSGGAYGLVQALAVVQEGQVRPVIGTAQELQPAALSMLAVKRDLVRVARDHAPVEVAPDAPLAPGPAPGVALWASAEVGATTDMARLGRFASASCNPFEVREDGVALAAPNRPLAEVKARTPGAWTARRDGVLLVGSDGSDPRTNGRAYTVAWITDLPSPRCEDGEWLHPGATLTLRHTDPALLVGGARGLELRGTVYGGGPSPLRVEVVSEGVVRAALDLGVDALDGEPRHLPLGTAIAPGVGEITVVLRSPADGPRVLLNGLALTEAAPAGAPEPAEAPAPVGAGPGGGGAALLPGEGLDTVVLVPPDTDAAALGREGGLLVFEERRPTDARACLPRLPASPKVGVRGRVEVRELRDSRNAFQTAAVVLRFLGPDGAEVERAPGKPGVVVHRVAQGGWQDVVVQSAVPAAAAQVEVCVEFTGASGVLALESLGAEAR